jgi:hypothetical protein
MVLVMPAWRGERARVDRAESWRWKRRKSGRLGVRDCARRRCVRRMWTVWRVAGKGVS